MRPTTAAVELMHVTVEELSSVMSCDIELGALRATPVRDDDECPVAPIVTRQEPLSRTDRLYAILNALMPYLAFFSFLTFITTSVFAGRTYSRQGFTLKMIVWTFLAWAYLQLTVLCSCLYYFQDNRGKPPHSAPASAHGCPTTV